MSFEPTDNRETVTEIKSPQPALVHRTEQRLLVCARAGDPAAFESLVMPHRETILRRAQRILRNREDAEDIVQIAFLQAFRHLDGFQERSQFSSWLIRIATNAALMRLRVSRQKYEMSLDRLVDGTPAKFQIVELRPNPEQECSANEVRAMLDEAHDRLAPIYKEVLHLRHVEELSAKEAARILEVPVGTVKARLHRARLKLTRSVQSTLALQRKQSVTRNQRVAALISREQKLA